MSNADELQIWFDGVQLYDDGEISRAIEMFQSAKQTSKMMFNIGCCYLKGEDLDGGEEQFLKALESDKHLAIADFMLGLIYLMGEHYDLANYHFEHAHQKLRGNRYVDYQQLGFKYKLYSCEILTNRAVVAYRQRQIRKAKTLLLEAVGCKAERKHETIEESLCLLQSGYPINPFIPPTSEIFRPSKASVKNMKRKDYLGKAQVISTQNDEEIYACFSGVKDRRADFKRAPESRKKLMKDLKDVERKASLRPVPRPPKSLPRGSSSKTEQYYQQDLSPPAKPPTTLPRSPRFPRNSSVGGEDHTVSTPLPKSRPAKSLLRQNTPSLPSDELDEPRRKTSLPPLKGLPNLPKNPVPPARKENFSPRPIPESNLPDEPLLRPPNLNPKMLSESSTTSTNKTEYPQAINQRDQPASPSKSNKKKPPPPPPEDTIDNDPPSKPLHNRFFSTSSLEGKQVPTSLLPDENILPPTRGLPKEPDENYNDLVLGPDEGGEFYEAIDDMEIKYKPPRPPPILPRRNTEEITTSPSTKSPNYMKSGSVDSSLPRQRRESNAQRPNHAPPPPPEGSNGPSPPPVDYNNSTNSSGESSDLVVAPPRKFYPKSPNSSLTENDLKKELNFMLRKQSATLPPGFTDIQLPKKSSSLPATPQTDERTLEYDVEIQYTFVQKVKVQHGSSLDDVLKMAKEQTVPDDVELCFTDDLGRQQTLSEKKMKKIFDEDTTKVKKLFCFPDD